MSAIPQETEGQIPLKVLNEGHQWLPQVKKKRLGIAESRPIFSAWKVVLRPSMNEIFAAGKEESAGNGAFTLRRHF